MDSQHQNLKNMLMLINLYMFAREGFNSRLQFKVNVDTNVKYQMIHHIAICNFSNPLTGIYFIAALKASLDRSIIVY